MSSYNDLNLNALSNLGKKSKLMTLRSARPYTKQRQASQDIGICWRASFSSDYLLIYIIDKYKYYNKPLTFYIFALFIIRFKYTIEIYSFDTAYNTYVEIVEKSTEWCHIGIILRIILKSLCHWNDTGEERIDSFWNVCGCTRRWGKILLEIFAEWHTKRGEMRFIWHAERGEMHVDDAQNDLIRRLNQKMMMCGMVLYGGSVKDDDA